MKDGYRVKICGTTNLGDALISAKEGADYIGVVVEVDFSKRSLAIEEAEELFSSCPVPVVALVFHMSEDRINYMIQKLKPFAVQFLSQESYDLINRLKRAYPDTELWQSIHLPCAGSEVEDLEGVKNTVSQYIDAGIDLLLYDTVATIQGVQKFGGTGLTSDWTLIRRLMDEIDAKVPVLLAGGIKPENVEEALNSIDPDGVDLCSGVEAVQGRKDPEKIRNLMEKVRKKI